MDFLPDTLLQLLPLGLYAELHYTFRYGFSFIKKLEPEILADMPFRLNNSSRLPVLILIKDSDAYPIELKGIEAHLSWEKNHEDKIVQLLDKGLSLKTPLHHEVLFIDLPEADNQYLTIKILFKIKIKGQSRLIENDNFSGLSVQKKLKPEMILKGSSILSGNRRNSGLGLKARSPELRIFIFAVFLQGLLFIRACFCQSN